LATDLESSLIITLPAWVDELVTEFPALETSEERMALAIALARANVERGGGPFGAAVFAGSRLVAAGVNRVLESGFSIAHAEILALTSAQQKIGTTAGSLSGSVSLVTSTEPCCQCFGAIVWSGITELVCGATTADAEAVGFDEGPKPEAWPEVLAGRGIAVEREVKREEARSVLEEYARRGGIIYGLRHPTLP
jgi:tRNA(Arg) A34 adenosine deaminase TadA